MSLRIEYDERAIGQAAAFLDDPQGLREVLDAIDRLADAPRPDGSFPYRSPGLRRLRAGRYRVLHEMDHGGHGCRIPHLTRDKRLMRACDWFGYDGCYC